MKNFDSTRGIRRLHPSLYIGIRSVAARPQHFNQGIGHPVILGQRWAGHT